MASPEWFFSTLAQSSAAIIGFVLAFSAVLHQLERQQREKRTDELRDELIVLKENYVITSLLGELFWNIEGAGFVELTTNRQSDFDNILAKDPEEAINEFKNNPDVNLPYTRLCAIYFNTISSNLARIEAAESPAEDYLLSENELKEIRSAIRGLLDIFETLWLESPEFYFELNPAVDREEGAGEAIKRRVLGFPIKELGVGPDYYPNAEEVDSVRDSARFEESVAAEIREWGKERLYDSDEAEYEEDEDFTGKNLYSIESIVISFWSDFQKIDAHKSNTLLGYQPVVSKNIIKASGFLALIGVFVPIALLLTIPQSAQAAGIAGWTLTLIQSVVLVLSGLSTAYLLFIILKNLDSNWTGFRLIERFKMRIFS